MEDKVTITIPKGYVIDKEESTDEIIICKRVKNALPSTWEEFCETHPLKIGEACISSSSFWEMVVERERDPEGDTDRLPNKEYARAMLALCQLIQLRDCYNDGWEPNWESDEYKYVIRYRYNNIETVATKSYHCILAFKSSELVNKFANNFKELIETAKPLL